MRPARRNRNLPLGITTCQACHVWYLVQTGYTWFVVLVAFFLPGVKRRSWAELCPVWYALVQPFADRRAR